MLNSGTQEQIRRNQEAIMGAMRTLYFLVKHALPHTTLYGPLLDFCTLQGCDYLSNLHIAGNAHYRNQRIVQEFLAELDAQISTILEQLQTSPYIALMADETTDISVSKELILYGRYVIPTATPEKCVWSVFLHITELEDGKAGTITKAILEFLATLNIPIERVMGFGSDGASVMVGRRAGVSTLLKQSNPEMTAIHCVAHRLALAVAQAGDAVPYVKAFKTLLHNLYTFMKTALFVLQAYQLFRVFCMIHLLSSSKLRIIVGFHMKVPVRRYVEPCNQFMLACKERHRREMSLWQMDCTVKHPSSILLLHCIFSVTYCHTFADFLVSSKEKLLI